jgi:sugar/nucleoside kinase (ribokinase family)
MSYEILGLGCVAVDETLVVERFPAEDSKIQILSRATSVGGTTTTALLAAAKLGSPCAFAGTLGEDPASLLVLDTFQRAGIDISLIRRDPAARPIRCTILLNRSSGSRTVLYDLEGAVPTPMDWPPEESIRAARLLLVDQFGTAGNVRAAQIARRANLPTIADLEQDDPRPEFLGFFGQARHLVFSRELALGFTRTTAIPAALERLASKSQDAVIITAGDKGVWFVSSDSPGKLQHEPAFAVQVRDTTGCGDVFRGAYAAALLEGRPVAAAVRFSAAAAALRATAESQAERLPTREGILKLIATRGAIV